MEPAWKKKSFGTLFHGAVMFKITNIMFLFPALITVMMMKNSWAEKKPLLDIESQIMDFSSQKMKSSINQLNQKIGACSKLAQKTRLSPTMTQFNFLTAKDLKVALLYFAFYSESKCQGAGIWAKATQDFAQFNFKRAKKNDRKKYRNYHQ